MKETNIPEKMPVGKVDAFLKENPEAIVHLKEFTSNCKVLKPYIDNPNEGLVYAVESKLPYLVSFYLQEGANPEYYTFNANKPTRTPLDKALNDGSDEIVKILIDNQTPEERKNTLYGLRELLTYVDNNNAKFVEILLKKGINPDQQSLDGRIPLLSASYLGFVPIIDLLLKYGATVDLADSNGVTSLMLATGKENIGAIEALLAAGANPDYVDDTDSSSRDIAQRSSNAVLIKLLSKKKADRKRSPRTIKRKTTKG